MDPARWRDRDVFVTGHTGFKGAWLCVLLEQLGARVHGYALPTPDTFLFHRAGLAATLASEVSGDIRDTDTLTRAIADSGADTVLHLAAQSIVRESYRDPIENFSSNVIGTASVIVAAQQVPGVEGCVVVTTDKVYANDESGRAYDEGDRLGGDDPYSASKACAELVSHSLAVSYPDAALGVATARAGNVVGGGDATPDALVPALINAFAGGYPAELRHPEAVRPWQHVLEPLSGYLTLAEHLPARNDQSFNFGPTAADTLTVGSVADTMAELWGDGAGWQPTGDKGPHEAGLLSLDSTRAGADLAWHPTLGARLALEWTVAWEREVRGGRTPLEVTREQVADYVTRAA